MMFKEEPICDLPSYLVSDVTAGTSDVVRWEGSAAARATVLVSAGEAVVDRLVPTPEDVRVVMTPEGMRL